MGIYKGYFSCHKNLGSLESISQRGLLIALMSLYLYLEFFEKALAKIKPYLMIWVAWHVTLIQFEYRLWYSTRGFAWCEFTNRCMFFFLFCAYRCMFEDRKFLFLWPSQRKLSSLRGYRSFLQSNGCESETQEDLLDGRMGQRPTIPCMWYSEGWARFLLTLSTECTLTFLLGQDLNIESGLRIPVSIRVLYILSFPFVWGCVSLARKKTCMMRKERS